MMSELISIIIPVYNSEKYLEKCLDSVIMQTYSNIEIVIINDGSTDKSGGICELYEKQDSRIKVCHISNGGVSNARNLGIQICKGQYICFVDSDDTIKNNYIEELYRDLVFKKSDLSICGVEVKGKHAADLKSRFKEIKLNKNYIEEFLELNKSYLLYGPCNKIYKTTVIKSNHILFDVTTSYGEDLLFNFQYLSHIEKISYTDNTNYFYIKQNEKSLSSVFRDDAFENEKRINKIIFRFLQERQMLSLEAENYLSDRILDVAYNQVLYWGIVKKKYSEIKKVLGDSLTINALAKYKCGAYSSKVIWLMKRRYIFILIVYIRLYYVKSNHIGN